MPTTYKWTGTTNTTWSTAGNWSPSGPPATGDKVIIDADAAKSITGFDASATQLAQLDIYASASNSYAIGTPASPLKVGATVCNIDLPDPSGGGGSGLSGIYIDLGSSDAAVTQHPNGATGSNGREPRIVAGTGTGNTLYHKGGLLGVGTMTDAQASTFATVIVSGGTLNVGSNVTLATLTNKGGTVLSASSVTTFNNYATSTLTGLAKIATTLNNYGGTFYPNGRPASGATIATCNQRGGTLDISTDLRTLTITALSDGGGNITAGTIGASHLTVTGTSLYWGDGSGRGTQVN